LVYNNKIQPIITIIIKITKQVTTKTIIEINKTATKRVIQEEAIVETNLYLSKP